MKVLRYPLAVAILVALIYLGLARTGYIRVQPTLTLAPAMHTVDAHSNAHSRVENAHSTVEMHTVTPEARCVVLTGIPEGYLNLRAGAGMEYAVLKVLAEGEELIRLPNDQNGWLEVQSGQVVGWVNGMYIGECE